MTAALFVCMALNIGAANALEHCAQQQADRYAENLNVKAKVYVRVVDDPAHFAAISREHSNGRHVLAYTVREELGAGFVMRLRPSVATDAETIAHECCHVALDGDIEANAVLTPEEREKRERRAEKCAALLVRR